MNSLPTGEYNEAIRVTEIGWMRQAPDIMWFYERLAGIFRAFNEQIYHYDLRGLSEPPQFLVYRDTDSGHFDWHMDVGRGQPRKLSLTLQLTDPARYEGGELQFNTGTETMTAMPKDRGVAITFPSYLIHRVTPVTSGIRKAIVAWASGPDFK